MNLNFVWYLTFVAAAVRCEDAVEVRLSVTVDEEGNTKELFVPAGEEPEGAALLFCSDTLAEGIKDKDQLAECVAEMSGAVLAAGLPDGSDCAAIDRGRDDGAPGGAIAYDEE